MYTDHPISYTDALRAKLEWNAIFKKKEDEIYRLQNDLPLLLALRKILLGGKPSDNAIAIEAYLFRKTLEGQRVTQLIFELEEMIIEKPEWLQANYGEASLFADIQRA